MRSRAFALAAALVLVTTTVRADGPGAYRPREAQQAPLSEQGAIDAYNAGYALILRAEHAEALAAASTKEADRKASKRDVQEAYRAALDKFTAATRSDASMHEAYTYIGYSNRKLGRYDEAIQAYEQALRITPDYPHAIEYQGEAFLGLNRIEEARFNYLRLYALSPGLAAKLLKAMQAWVEANRARPPQGVDIDGFAAWVAERADATRADLAESGSSW